MHLATSLFTAFLHFILWELEYKLAHNEGTGTEDVADDDDQGQLDRLDLGSRHQHRGGPGVLDTQLGCLKGAVLYNWDLRGVVELKDPKGW